LIDTNTESKNLLRSYAYWLPPAVAGLALTLIYLNPFIGDWDGLDYTVASIRGEPSSMALGRALFTLANHAIYMAAHNLFAVPPEQAYLIFKFAVVAQAPLAIIACWILARDLTDSRESATVTASLVALSPMMVIYGGQVMTDVPSVFLLATALAIHLRGLLTKRIGLVLAGAIVLGLAVNMRETAGLYFPWLVFAPFVAGWKLDRRTVVTVLLSLAVFALFAFGIFVLWYVTHAVYRATWNVWAESSQNEAARHPLQLANLKPFFVYLFLASPLVFVAFPFAIWRGFRSHRWSLLLVCALCGLFADAMLFFNYSTIINWRYFLTGLPAMAPIAGDYLFRSQSEKLNSARRGLITAIVGVLVIAVAMGFLFRPRSNEYLNRLALAKAYKATLDLLPRDAVVMAGAQTVAVTYWRGIGTGQWEHIGTGAGFPAGKLEEKIEEHLRAGRRLFLDMDPRWWQPCSWQAAEIRELASIEPRFHFQKVTATIYEIRLVEDASASDNPHLEKLLPENRAEEVRKCISAG
jgi:dolichyl-phosphate-mannose-protein mannosyltransferase